MLWKTQARAEEASSKFSGPPDGRFVLHRHRDARGPHYDLRLEWRDALLGWRIEADSFLDALGWAEEKMPHPCHWLTQDGDAIREDAGLYRWGERRDDVREVLLEGKRGRMVVRFEALQDVPTRALAALHETLACMQVDPQEAPRLIQDGLTARHRAIARLCGLGKELDGTAFNEVVWKKALAALSLDEIHQQLRAFETRFDRVYPPEPLSRPERLDESEGDLRRGLEVLRGSDHGRYGSP